MKITNKVFARHKKYKRQGRFRSNFELKLSQQLTDYGAKWKYELTRYIYYVPTTTPVVCPNCGPTKALAKHEYLPDFFLSNGVVLEGKGRLTAPDRRKLEAVRKYHPSLDLRIIFYYDRKYKANGERYSDWADKAGIPWAVGKIPEEWLLHSDQAFPKNWKTLYGDKDYVPVPKIKRKKKET